MERTASPQTSMTLSITRSTAKLMLEASHALHQRLAQLGEGAPSCEPGTAVPDHEMDDADPPVPKRVVSSFSDHSSGASEEGAEAALRPINLEAADSCGNPLIESFVRGLQANGVPSHEVQTCLLLFLQASKSSKLRSAFDILSSVASASAQSDERTVEKETLSFDGASALFRCFLTAIASCIQYKAAAPSTETEAMDLSSTVPVKQECSEPPTKAIKDSEQSSPNSVAQADDPAKEESLADELPRASPSFDSSMDSKHTPATLSEDTRREIDEIALFASDKLMEHVRKQAEDKNASTVTYASFGDWYNLGGFEIVPWLELLDLSKYDSSEKPPVEVPKQEEKVARLDPIQEETVSSESTTEKSNPPQAEKQSSEPKKESPINFFKSDEKEKKAKATSRTVISFDFTGAMSSADPATKTGKTSPCCIDITEENLLMLRNLVHRTGLFTRSPSEVSNILLRHAAVEADVPLLRRDAFGRCIRELVPEEAARSFSRPEMENFSTYFTNFYSCFDDGSGKVNAKEVTVAFAFLCAGNKSAKLTIGFELLDKEKSGHLTQQQLLQYIRSYLTMLVGISMLSANPGDQQKDGEWECQRRDMIAAVENGARWTVRHFMKHFAEGKGVNPDAITFDHFASWYTSGGYNVAPWLELLDLSKLLTLLKDESLDRKREAAPSRPLSSPRRRPESQQPSIPPSEILFTFPLAHRRSLVVLREDASYVKTVVENLGLLTKTPDEVWPALFDRVKSEPALPAPTWNRPRPRKAGTGKARDVDQAMFVKCMEGVLESGPGGRKRPPKGTKKTSSSARETLKNFFQSFDLDQVDRVAVNQLMGGLSLLCGGKKSTKLAFAFGLFDCSKPKPKKKIPQPTLSGEELFVYLRSFLIVTFSCCRQSMDLSAEAVSRYISDTAHMVAEDVMRYQWHKRKTDRIGFDEFGEWYNEGGFETAPWLELLDLKKWVLVDNLASIQQQRTSAMLHRGLHLSKSEDFDCPPAPPDDAVDPSFFADDDNGLMPMDSIDEMDLMLMRQPSSDKDDDGARGGSMFASFLASPKAMQHRRQPSNSLKFHLVTDEDHGGYMLSVSERRVASLRNLLLESGLCQIESEDACRKILASSKKSKAGGGVSVLSKDDFDSAMRSLLLPSGKSTSIDSQRTLSDLLSAFFLAFDRTGSGLPNAREVACGLTVLCRGKKSDKLEFAFELLKETQNGRMNRREVHCYLRSFLSTLLSLTMAPCFADDSEDSLCFLNSGARCDRSILFRAAEAGSEWATKQVFQSHFKKESDKDTLSFDEFAEWYTSEGFSSIPWLELLDLRKWVLAPSS